MSSESTASREAALYGAKLQAVVAARWGPGERRAASFSPGAALMASEGRPGPEAWLYLAEAPERGLGPALVWADHHGVAQVHLLADASSPPHDQEAVLARQAAYFVDPALAVWRITGRELDRVAPSPLPVLPVPEPAPELVDALIDAGLEIVVEGGVVRGEVNGLEVARIVHQESTAGVPLERPLLEVGVGAADRELTAALYGELSPVEQVGRAVDIVRAHRRADAAPHPLNRLVPERWLRAMLCRSPAVVGLAGLRPAQGPQARTNLRDRHIAVAVGETSEQRTVVVACSVGVDLRLVPDAAEARAALDPGAALWLVVPERDDHPTTRRLASRLRDPARVVPVTDDWRTRD